MRLLLDTHVLMWTLAAADRLPVKLRAMLADPANEVFYSSVSLAEIGSKRGRGRRSEPSLGAERVRIRADEVGFTALPLTAEHAVAVEGLALFHGDPFDRLLLAQARTAGLQLVTHDERLAEYDSRTILF